MSESKETHKQLTDLQHVIDRSGMYVGSTKKQTNTIYLYNSKKNIFELQDVKFVPAWYKIVDEIMVNAIDRNTLFPKKVNRIEMSFYEENGMIEIINNGPGISQKDFKLNNGEIVPLPQAIASAFRMGSNFDSNQKRITGGLNGLGIKLVNAYSDYLKLFTISKVGRKYKSYSQEFENRLSIIHEPIIEETKEEEFTSIKFIPSYKNMGYSKLSLQDKKILNSLVETRAYQASAFVNADVLFNNQIINIGDSFEDFAQMFINNDYGMFHTILKNKKDKDLNWEICIGVSDGKFRQVSLINGIYVFKGGSHIKHLQNEIVKNLKSRAMKILGKQNKFNSNFILNNLFIVFKASFDKPTFNSQIKCELNDPIENFIDYKFKKTEWAKIWSFLKDHVTTHVLDKNTDKKKSRVERGRIELDKGKDATYAGSKKNARKTSLIVCEGDSAMACVDRGITHKKTKLSYEYYGTFSIQGVPMNARKECKQILDKKNNKTHLVRNLKLKNNQRFQDLVKLLGLDYEKSYDPDTIEGQQEIKTLRYGRVIMAVDQDEDGKGNIFGLLVNFFMLFWPNLAKIGFVKRFNTPIIRAYLRSSKTKPQKCEEFYSLSSYEKWLEKNFSNNNDKMLKKYNIKYFKGLGGHDQKKGEILTMFTNFEDKLITYSLNNDGEKDLESYYGKKTEPRKIALAVPVSREDELLLDGENEVSISLLLKTDVKEFQRDNIMRKLPHSIDGMVPSRRKVFYTARHKFGITKSTNKEIKVCSFTGDVMSYSCYHHGDASLSETIIKMCQDFPGSKNMPLLIGVGEFGTKSEGGKNHASPRYTSLQLNQSLCWALCPKEDDFLLNYEFDDGVRCEPTFYIPIIPLSIMEHMEIPATGWKAKVWARDYKQVIKNVKWMITGKFNKCRKMKIWLKDNNCDLRKWKGKTYAVGKYSYNEKTRILTISELPPCIYDESYKNKTFFTTTEVTKNGKKEKKKVLKSEFTNNYRVDSSYDEITNNYETKIWIELQPGAMDKIMARKATKSGDEYQTDEKDNESDNESIVSVGSNNTVNTNSGYPFDPVEDFMNLKLSLGSNLNMIAWDGTVKEYKRYEEIFDEWFQVRKQLYAARIDRMIILTNLMIKYLENIIKFSKNKDKYNLTNKTPIKKFEEILESHGYDTFNKALLFSPKYTKVEELEHLIINNVEDGTSYNYIIDLTYRQLLKEAHKKRLEELEKEKEKLKFLLEDSDESNGNFKGKKTWLAELVRVKKIIEDGVKNGWAS